MLCFLVSILAETTDGKEQLGRSRIRWEGNTKIDLRKIGRGGIDWIDLAQDRDMLWALVNAVMKMWVP